METLDGGHGRQEPLGEHQGLGHNVHQDCVALSNAKEDSTLHLKVFFKSLGSEPKLLKKLLKV